MCLVVFLFVSLLAGTLLDVVFGCMHSGFGSFLQLCPWLLIFHGFFFGGGPLGSTDSFVVSIEFVTDFYFYLFTFFQWFFHCLIICFKVLFQSVLVYGVVIHFIFRLTESILYCYYPFESLSIEVFILSAKFFWPAISVWSLLISILMSFDSYLWFIQLYLCFLWIVWISSIFLLYTPYLRDQLGSLQFSGHQIFHLHSLYLLACIVSSLSCL